MSSEASIVLHRLCEELQQLDRKIVGTPQIVDDVLVSLDGNLRISVIVHTDAEIHPAIAHCHVIAELQQPPGTLDACVMGINQNRQLALADAAGSWVELVAGPLFSLLHNQSVLQAKKLDADNLYGISGADAYVGPLRFRMFDKPVDVNVVNESPMLDCVAAMAEPSDLHLVKVTLESKGAEGWVRNIEMDGHIANHADRPWRDLAAVRQSGVASRFAVVRFDNSAAWIAERQRLDDAIRRFVELYLEVADTHVAADRLRAEGIDEKLAHQIRELVPIALGRNLLAGLEIAFPPDYIRLRADGSIVPNLMLMSEPVFARASILDWRLREAGLGDAVKGLATSGAEFNAINNALNGGTSAEALKNAMMMPLLVSDANVSQAAFQRGLQQAQAIWEKQRPSRPQKPWWKFW